MIRGPQNLIHLQNHPPRVHLPQLHRLQKRPLGKNQAVKIQIRHPRRIRMISHQQIIPIHRKTILPLNPQKILPLPRPKISHLSRLRICPLNRQKALPLSQLRTLPLSQLRTLPLNRLRTLPLNRLRTCSLNQRMIKLPTQIPSSRQRKNLPQILPCWILPG